MVTMVVFCWHGENGSVLLAQWEWWCFVGMARMMVFCWHGENVGVLLAWWKWWWFVSIVRMIVPMSMSWCVDQCCLLDLCRNCFDTLLVWILLCLSVAGIVSILVHICILICLQMLCAELLRIFYEAKYKKNVVMVTWPTLLFFFSLLTLNIFSTMWRKQTNKLWQTLGEARDSATTQSEVAHAFWVVSLLEIKMVSFAIFLDALMHISEGEKKK